MQKYGGKDIIKVPRISLNLLALKTETEGRDGFATCFILQVSKAKIFDTGSTGKINSGALLTIVISRDRAKALPSLGPQ